MLTDRPGPAPAPFWVQRLEPDVVEGADHPAHVLLGAVQQVRDVRDGLTLRRHQHHDRPPQPDRVPGGAADPLQPLTFGHRDRPDEYLWRTSHRYLRESHSEAASQSPS